MGGKQKKQTHACILSIIFIFLLLFCSTPFSAQKFSDTIIVDDDGSADYVTITEAIGSSTNGDTIFVRAGTYEESNIILDKKISLIGEEPSSTIIRGNGISPVLTINADNVLVTNLSINKGGDWQKENIGVFANDVIIKNNIIEQGNGSGISIHNSSGSIIQDNIVQSNQEGIMCYNCIELLICNNQVSESLVGIYLYNSKETLVKVNMVTSCNKGIYLEESIENTIQQNQLSSNDQGTYVSYSADNFFTENNFVSNIEQAKFTTWLSPTGLQLSKWDSNYWDDKGGFLPKVIFGVLFIRTYNPIGIFLPWFAIDWHPADEPYDITMS